MAEETSKTSENIVEDNGIKVLDSLFAAVAHASKCLAFAAGTPNFCLATPAFLAFMVWCCFLMPPVAVVFRSYRRDGNAFTVQAAYNVILCFFLWVPGMLHALWFCFGETVRMLRRRVPPSDDAQKSE
ncbi:hypothetical protein niasHS_006292 [Heterodera schachtii]|uniref:Uncharacterized protein n=2 Tax=Heterodera TaxID=34509 RepID=A0ABD2JT67_HETSC